MVFLERDEGVPPGIETPEEAIERILTMEDSEGADRVLERTVRKILAMRGSNDRGEIPEEDVIRAIDKFILDFGLRGLKLLNGRDK